MIHLYVVCKRMTQILWTGLRSGLNCVSFDEQYAKAFNFMLGDVVVVRVLKELLGIWETFPLWPTIWP